MGFDPGQLLGKLCASIRKPNHRLGQVVHLRDCPAGEDELMVSKCANPSCLAQFDHGEGRLFRFPKRAIEDGRSANTHSVQHFWLCGKCFSAYVLEYHDGVGVAMIRRSSGTPGPGPRKFIAAA